MKYLTSIFCIATFSWTAVNAENKKNEFTINGFGKIIESKIEKLNSNFPGYIIRYRKVNDSDVLILYTTPPPTDKNNGVHHLGVAVLLNKDGHIVNVTPISK